MSSENNSGGSGGAWRPVVVTRLGPDAFLVRVGDAVLALTWLELWSLACETGAAARVTAPVGVRTQLRGRGSGRGGDGGVR